jgi:hypothetical protein
MGSGGGQGTTTQQQSTPPQIAPELQPLVNSSVQGTIATQNALPLTNFTQPNPQQIPGLTPTEQSLTGQITQLPNNPNFYLPFETSQKAADSIMQPFGQSPSYDAFAKNFQDIIAPQVKQSVALSGPVDSGAMDYALAQAAGQSALPLMQQNEQLRAGMVPAEAQAGATQASAIPGLFNSAETAAAMPRDIATQQSGANMQDFLRLFGLSQQATLGPTQSILPAYLQPGSITTTSGGSKGMFK